MPRRSAGSTGGRPPSSALQRRHRQPRPLELVPVVLGRLAWAGPDDRLTSIVDLIGNSVALLKADPRQDPRERLSDVLEGVVVVVADDHAPLAAEIGTGAGGAGTLDGAG